MQLIDTHVHINFEAFEADLAAVRDRWQAAGVVHLVHSCVEPGEFPKTQRLADQIPELSFSVGLHPLDAPQWSPSLATELDQLARSDDRVVAIGETGLDFYKSTARSQQFQAFEAQLVLAQELSLPVIIHCRDAASDMVEFLRQFISQYGLSSLRGVMHCWSGSPEETQWFLDLGFHISFSGTVTFKNATTIHAAAQMVPSDRLLIETDCPFLAPVPKRGERRNEPAYVRFVAERLAHLRQTSLDELAMQTTQNASRLFNLAIAPSDPVLVEAPACA
jgi:TatD DNase family protein